MTTMNAELVTALDGLKNGLESRMDDRLDVMEAQINGFPFARTDSPRPERVKKGRALTPDSKMADLHPSPEAGEFRIGAFLGAAVTGKTAGLSDVEHKALAEGTGSAGGFLLAPQLASTVIDRARAKARVIEAGARTFPMETGDAWLPRLSGGVQGAWRPENSAASIEDPVFERVTLTAKTCAVLTLLSRELFEDLGTDSYEAIERELVAAIALKLDYAALRGSGTGSEPRGIRNTAGVTVASIGGVNGATPADYDFLLDSIAAIESANGTPTATIYTPRTARTLRGLTTGIAGDKTKLVAPVAVSDLTHLTTTQVENNLTLGTSVNTSEVFTGDYTQMVIGVRPEIGVRVLPLMETFAANLQIGILAYLRADVALAHPAHFAVTTGVRP